MTAISRPQVIETHAQRESRQWRAALTIAGIVLFAVGAIGYAVCP